MEDITLEKVEEVCAAFPEPVEMRLLGGEPTIHPKISEIIKIVKQYRHMPTIISNGIKFGDEKFCKMIKQHGYIIPSLSIDSDATGHQKHQAILNLEKHFNRFSLTATLTGKNDFWVEYMKFMQESIPRIRYVHFRSLIQGSLTLEQMENKIRIYWPEWDNPYKVIRDGRTFKKCQHCQQCILKAVTPNLHILLVDDHKSDHCFLRGFIDPINMVINPFWETIRERL
jgi:organic radical activating enzyme